jgi:hypothetical protein
MFKLLEITEEDSSTIINNEKLFLIYDMPLLIKSLGSNLLNGDFEISKNKIVAKNDVQYRY